MKNSPLLAKLLAVAGFAPAPQVEDAPAPAADAVTDATPDLSAEVETLKAALADAEGKLVSAQAEATAALEAKVHEIAAEADKHVAELTALLDAANASVSALQAAATTKLAAERKEKIVAAVGTARAPELIAATEKMDDVSFNAVLTAVSVGAAAEARSKLFTEVGVDAEVKPATVADEGENNGTMRILRAQFQPK